MIIARPEDASQSAPAFARAIRRFATRRCDGSIRFVRTSLFFLIAGALLLAPTVHADVPRPGDWAWRFIAGGPIAGWPAVDDRGHYYFTAEDRFLYALDSEGVMRWRTDLGRRSAGMVAVGADQSIYVVLEDGRLLAINKDGRLLWEIRLARGRQLPPVILATGTVVVSDTTGRVVAVTHAGIRIWEIELGESLSSAPIVNFEKRLVFGTVRGNLVTVDPSGRIIERRYVGDVPSVVAPYPGGVLVGTTSGRLIKMQTDGEPAWRTDLGSAVADLVVGTDAEAYAQLDDGSLAHASASGVVTWRANPTPATIESVTAADGALVAISGGSLAHITRDGNLSWQIRLPSTPLLVALSGRGSAAVSTGGWVTYSYPIDLEPRGSWPSVRGRAQATGVPPGVVVGRPAAGEFSDSFDYIYLSESLRSPFENDQMTGLREIAGRQAGGGLAGSYPYVLGLCEDVAGAPYYGSVGFDGRVTVSRSARSLAISSLGTIGDLYTSRFLLRLLRAEEAVDFQVEILAALSELGTGSDGEAVQTVVQAIASDSTRVPSDQLALAAVAFLEAVYTYEGGFLSADGVLLLTRIMSGPYGRSTREAAAAALSGLSSVK